MAKRFIETTIWTQNKWFRKLSVEMKLLWIYLFTNCDAVGVWEEDLELASFVIGYTYTIDSLLEFKEKLKKINNKKFWIVDFCNFQYGVLNEEKLSNKPHQSYIKILKNHNLWIDYKKTIDSLKYKEQEEEEDKETEKEKPTFEIFKEYVLTIEPDVNIKSLEYKYNAWKENGWKDGNNKKIKNWKTKISNTLQYLDKNGEKGFQNNKGSNAGSKETNLPSDNLSTEWSK